VLKAMWVGMPGTFSGFSGRVPCRRSNTKSTSTPIAEKTSIETVYADQLISLSGSTLA